MSIQSINPVTNQLLQTYTAYTKDEVNEKIQQTHQAWLQWKETGFEERAMLVRNMGAVLRKRKEEFAKLIALEMGKPIKAGRAEIEKCAVTCDYYADNAAAFLKEELVTTNASKSYVCFEPLGVVLAVMPWNFPFWQVFRFLAPALMAGNCGLLKHASNVPGSALTIEAIVKEAGSRIPVFQTLLIGSEAVSEVIEHPFIKAVTLTGSTDAGKKVAAKAASLVKKTVLELGGSDPYIILEDADLDKAAAICVDSRLNNSGQSCIAAKRFIPVASVEQEFTRLFKEKMAAKIIGDPLDENTQVGPQARADLRDDLHQQVLKSIDAGAVCILGGKIPAGNNAFYPCTILTNVKKGMPAFDEELFGPVAAIISAKDEKEAIQIANDTNFGLGAAVFTTDLQRGEKVACQLQAGSCFVNALVRSDPRLPFGGIHESGYGRELGVYGIKEFVNIKTVYIA